MRRGYRFVVTARPDAASTPPHRRRSLTHGIALAFLGLLASLALAETWIRIARPLPRRQMVRGNCLRSVEGVPVWGCENNREDSERQHRACVDQHPERTRILFFGSSITYGSELAAAEAFTTALEARLNEVRPTPGFCVLNFAYPGFSFEQKYAVARAEVARYRPALIMWEDWVEWMDYTLIGDTAYGTVDLAVRPDGFIGIAGVPDGLNRALLLHSRLYEYLTISGLGESLNRPSEHEEATAFANQRLIKVSQLAQSVGARLVLYLAPPLERPFTETAASPPDWHSVVLDFARAHAIPAYLLQRELIDQDYLTLRMDPCCHYNAEGHRALVPVMQRIVLQELDAR
jgi:hypothetical protein